MKQQLWSVAQRCGIVVWMENKGIRVQRPRVLLSLNWYMEEKYEICVLYHCSYFAGICKAVVWCCLMSHGRSLWQQQSPEFSEVVPVAAGSQSSIKVPLHLLCLSPTVLCFIYREEEKGCWRVWKCPSVFRKMLTIHSIRCEDSQIVVTLLVKGHLVNQQKYLSAEI